MLVNNLILDIKKRSEAFTVSRLILNTAVCWRCIPGNTAEYNWCTFKSNPNDFKIVNNMMEDYSNTIHSHAGWWWLEIVTDSGFCEWLNSLY